MAEDLTPEPLELQIDQLLSTTLKYAEGLTPKEDASNMARFAQACLKHIKDFTPLTQQADREHIGPKSTRPGIPQALGYAHLSTLATPDEDYFKSRSLEDWNMYIQNILHNPQAVARFKEKVWWPNSFNEVQRGRVIPSIVHKCFPDNPDLRGADFGAAAHATLPSLEDLEFYKLTQGLPYADPVTLAYGLGVDIQPPDIQWINACYWPIPSNRPDFERVRNGNKRAQASPDKYPFMIADLTGMLPIKDDLHFVFTSFLTPNIGDDTQKQQQLRANISQALSNKGIWINIGDELIPQGANPDTFDVKVYRKEGGELLPIGTPFKLSKDQATISSIDNTFFTR